MNKGLWNAVMLFLPDLVLNNINQSGNIIYRTIVNTEIVFIKKRIYQFIKVK